MQRWQGLGDVPGDWGPSAVTIGVFDGVHRGHQRIVARAAEVAATDRLPLVVVTFAPHPDEVIRPGSHPPLLCTLRRRVQLLSELGADAVCVLEFTLDFSRLSPDEFVHAVLADRLHARRVVVGENFRFGHRAAGDVAGAAHYLGRPHRVEGVVVRGAQRGRTLGIPTANLETPPYPAIPDDGVYAGWLASLDEYGLEAQRWPAAISVGTNPTFDGQHRVVEAYALDRDDLDLYGVHVAVDFTVRLRGMVRFDTVDALITQMHLDVGQARELTAHDEHGDRAREAQERR